MKYESGSSAESGCSRSDGPTDAEAERSRSALALLDQLMKFAEKEASHAMRQWHRCLSAELVTHPDYYTGRHNGMTIMIDELQRLIRENEIQAKTGG